MQRLRAEVSLFLLALSWLTRLPVPRELGWTPERFAESARYYPLVGTLVGLIAALVYWLAALWLPTLPALLLSTLATLRLTGAFHEDGLADSADGLGGGGNPERVLEIMKDSRIGSYGAIALVLALFTKMALLVTLAQVSLSWVLAGLLAAHVSSRTVPLFIIRSLKHVGDSPHSKSKPLADDISLGGLLVGVLWWAGAMVVVSYALPAQAWLLGSLGAVLGAAVVAWRLHRRIGGYTGDGLGASQQVAELAFYLGMLGAAGTA
jgi:adenosylcobinamide-GDP ribazoletransferase